MKGGGFLISCRVEHQAQPLPLPAWLFTASKAERAERKAALPVTTEIRLCYTDVRPA